MLLHPLTQKCTTLFLVGFQHFLHFGVSIIIYAPTQIRPDRILPIGSYFINSKRLEAHVCDANDKVDGGMRLGVLFEGSFALDDSLMHSKE